MRSYPAPSGAARRARSRGPPRSAPSAQHRSLPAPAPPTQAPAALARAAPPIRRLPLRARRWDEGCGRLQRAHSGERPITPARIAPYSSDSTTPPTTSRSIAAARLSTLSPATKAECDAAIPCPHLPSPAHEHGQHGRHGRRKRKGVLGAVGRARPHHDGDTRSLRERAQAPRVSPEGRDGRVDYKHAPGFLMWISTVKTTAPRRHRVRVRQRGPGKQIACRSATAGKKTRIILNRSNLEGSQLILGGIGRGEVNVVQVAFRILDELAADF